MIHRSGIVKGQRVHETPLGPFLPPDATDLRFAISSRQVWRPGIYDSERAARYAFRFQDEDLAALQARVNEASADPEQRVITFEMLRELRAALAATTPEDSNG